MADTVQTLLVSLEARMTQYEREMRKASGTANKRMSEIDARLARTNRVLQGFGANAFRGLAGGAAAALAPILSVSAALATAKSAMTEFDRIGKAAKASGLDAEFFQELEYSATLGGVGVEQLSTALAAFNRNAGMAAVGKGELVEKLKQLNPELLRNIILATDQEARIRLVADAIDRETDASRKAALAAAAFGDSGTRMVEMLKGGATALDDTADKARKLGIVIDRELIARGEALNDEFATATRVMDLEFKKAMIDLAPVLIATAQLAGAVARGIGGIVDSMKALEARSSAGLEDRLAFLQAGSLGNGPGNRSEGADNQAAAAEIAQIEAILRRRAIESLKEQLTAPKIVVDGGNIELPDFGSGGRNSAADATIRQAEAVQKLIADLQFEKLIIGETALEQEILNTLRNAGVDSASAEGVAIRGLIADLDAQKTAMQATADAMREFEGIAENALSSFISDLREGKSGAEALSNVLNSILDNVIQIGIQSLVGGLFGGGGGFGALFGFAKGGIAANGRPQPLPMFARGGVSKSAAIFGEAGPEAAVPLPDGRRIPVDLRMQAPPMASGQNQNGMTTAIMVQLSPDLEARILQQAAGQSVQIAGRVAGQQIKSNNQQLPSIMQDINMRRG